MKRYTETDKWSDPTFYRLTPLLKCAWFHILETADKAGFWFPEFTALSGWVGAPVDQTQALQAFSSWIFVHPAGVWQIKGFFRLQYPKATPSKCNNVAKSAFNRLSEAASLLGPCVYQVAGVADADHPSPPLFSGQASSGCHQPMASGRCETETETETEIETEPETVTEPPKAIPPEAPPDPLRDVGLAMLKASADRAGFAWPRRLTEQVQQAARELIQAHGAGRVDSAFRLYLAKFNGPRSFENFLAHADAWINQVPATRDTCRHERTRTVDADLDEFTHGEKERKTVCLVCSHVVKASRFRPEHEHGWKVRDVDAVNAAAVRAGIKGVEPYEQCELCGVSRPVHSNLEVKP